MKATDKSTAKTSLSKPFESAQKGEEVIIDKNGEPIAKLVAESLDNKPRDMSVRIWEGEVWKSDDFDEYSSRITELFHDTTEL